MDSNTLWYLITDNQEILGILVAAGFSYLVYMHILRINNFFKTIERFDHETNILCMRVEVNEKKEIVFKKTGNVVSEQEAVKIVAFLNFLVQVGIMYEKGFIDRELVYLHLTNVITSMERNSMSLIVMAEDAGKSGSIYHLIRELKKRSMGEGRKLIKS